MSHCDNLLRNYQRFVRLPWSNHLAGKQRVWFAVYPPAEERRIRAHIQEFQVATIDAGHKWHLVDITDIPARWLAGHDYRDGYFADPSALQAVEEEIRARIVEHLAEALNSPTIDDQTVVAVMGTGALYGFAHVSPIIAGIEDSIRGRLLVFFPGEYERNLYRFMDARDGFNYMAVPITTHESVLPS
jgi:hypothetical protein